MILHLPIFITGFMGAGKTRVGRRLARRLGRIFIDTDEMAEARAGKSVARVFAEEGEQRFRDLERECVAYAASQSAVVVALGGGALEDGENLRLVERSGILVWLKVDTDTVLERVGRRDDRPLLAGLDPARKRARIEQLLAARTPVYSRAQIHMEAHTDGGPDETVDELLRALEDWCAHHRHRAG